MDASCRMADADIYSSHPICDQSTRTPMVSERLKTKEGDTCADYADYHLAARKARDAYERGHRQKTQSIGTGALTV